MAVSGWLGFNLWQQQDTRPQSGMTSDNKPESMQHTGERSDDLFASWLLVGGNNEIALAELAQSRAQNPEVKRFAEMMIKDHQELAGKLQQFASATEVRGGAAAKNEGPGADPKGNQPGQGGQNRPQDTSGIVGASSSRGSVEMVALVDELGAQCLESSRKTLEQKQGAEFDRCYMGMAVGAHKSAKDMMTVFQRHASPELAKLIEDGQRTVSMHLEHAEKLFKQLEGQSDERAPGNTRAPDRDNTDNR